MSYHESRRDERIAYALESIAKELGILNKQISVVAKEPSADVVKVETIKVWLSEIAFNNAGIDNNLSDACCELISRLDGLRKFALEKH